MAETVRDVLIRFRVEGPRAGGMGSPAAGSVGVPGGSGMAAGLSPGQGGAGADGGGTIKALADLTTSIIQLTIVTRLAMGGGGLIKSFFAMGGAAGAGHLGGSLLFKSAMVVQRIAPIGLPIMAAGLALSARAAIEGKVDDALGIDELEPEFGQRGSLRAIRGIGAVRTGFNILRDIPAALQETMRRGGVLGARELLKATGRPIPRHLRGPEIVAGIGVMRADRSRQFARGYSEGNFNIDQGRLGQMGRQGIFIGGGTYQSNFAAGQGMLQQSYDELRRLEGGIPQIPESGIGLPPGAVSRSQGQALAGEEAAQNQRLSIMRQIVTLEQQRLGYARQQLQLAGNAAVNMARAGPAGVQLMERMQGRLDRGERIGTSAIFERDFLLGRGLMLPGMETAFRDQVLQEQLQTPAGRRFLTPILPQEEMNRFGIGASSKELEDFINTDLPAFTDKLVEAIQKAIQGGAERQRNLQEEGQAAAGIRNAVGDEGAAQRAAAGRQ